MQTKLPKIKSKKSDLAKLNILYKKVKDITDKEGKDGSSFIVSLSNDGFLITKIDK